MGGRTFARRDVDIHGHILGLAERMLGESNGRNGKRLSLNIAIDLCNYCSRSNMIFVSKTILKDITEGRKIDANPHLIWIQYKIL